MNDDIATAREAIDARFRSHNLGEYGYFDHPTYAEDVAALMRYGLAVHVEACEWRQETYYDSANSDYGPKCGDSWYCDRARENFPELTGGTE